MDEVVGELMDEVVGELMGEVVGELMGEVVGHPRVAPNPGTALPRPPCATRVGA